MWGMYFFIFASCEPFKTFWFFFLSCFLSFVYANFYDREHCYLFPSPQKSNRDNDTEENSKFRNHGLQVNVTLICQCEKQISPTKYWYKDKNKTYIKYNAINFLTVNWVVRLTLKKERKKMRTLTQHNFVLFTANDFQINFHSYMR